MAKHDIASTVLAKACTTTSVHDIASTVLAKAFLRENLSRATTVDQNQRPNDV